MNKIGSICTLKKNISIPPSMVLFQGYFGGLDIFSLSVQIHQILFLQSNKEKRYITLSYLNWLRIYEWSKLEVRKNHAQNVIFTLEILRFWKIFLYLYTEGKYIQSPKHGSFQHHVWGIGYIFPQCTDTPNFIFAIKQGGLGLTLEVYNSLLAQLA